MKSLLRFNCGPLYSAALLFAGFSLAVAASAAVPEKKPARSKASAPSKAAKPGATTKLDQYIAANMKFLNLLSRYADALAGATDVPAAGLAVTKIEFITKDAITAGEEIVKLGRPAPELEAKLAKNSDIVDVSRSVAERTRSAVKALAANPEVKVILTPSIETFQAALNRIQQSADDPGSPATPTKTTATTDAPKPSGNPPPGRKTDGGSAPVAQEDTLPPPPPPQ